MRWIEVAVEATHESADAVSNVLIEAGCTGTVSGDSSVRGSRAVRVMGYLPADDRFETRLGEVRARVSELPSLGLGLADDEIGVRWIHDRAWATAWKRFFKPVSVGRIVVSPSWERFRPRRGEVVIALDPGMAFGTGYHPTTQLCLLALQETVHGGEMVLDVGTGSGILAMAAVKLGAARAVGIDIDSVAVEVARDNVKRAGLAGKIEIIRADSPTVFQSQADIVLANIIAKTIIDMATDLWAAMRHGGTLITSGIISERSDEVRDELGLAGLRTVELKQDGDWIALVSERLR